MEICLLHFKRFHETGDLNWFLNRYFYNSMAQPIRNGKGAKYSGTLFISYATGIIERSAFDVESNKLLSQNRLSTPLPLNGGREFDALVWRIRTRLNLKANTQGLHSNYWIKCQERDQQTNSSGKGNACEVAPSMGCVQGHSCWGDSPMAGR